MLVPRVLLVQLVLQVLLEQARLEQRDLLSQVLLERQELMERMVLQVLLARLVQRLDLLARLARPVR